MYLTRSDKARQELGSRERTLNLRERGALFLADGSKTLNEMQGLLQDDGGILERLIANGYLVLPHSQPSADVPAPISVTANVVHAVPLVVDSRETAPSLTAHSFEGKRSLATTRMFLFDICERMFIRRDPALASRFRGALREARDRASMLEIARDIVLAVEAIGGAERASGLGERIAMLLPPEHDA